LGLRLATPDAAVTALLERPPGLLIDVSHLGGSLASPPREASRGPGFAGSDLEAAVHEVARIAVLHGADTVTDETFLASFSSIVPLSRTSPERIE
jgi:hypothetical protein